MKRFFALLLAAAIILSFSGCGSSKSDIDLSGKDLIQPSSQPEEAPASEDKQALQEEELPAESEEPEPTEPVEIVSFEESGEYQLAVLSTGDCAIIGYSGKDEYLELPETLNDKTVISIGEKTFYGSSSLKTLIIPGCITDIGKEAFASCKNLSALTLNDGLLNIGESAFQGCAKLLAVKIPDSVKLIGGFAFKGCKKLQELKLPEGLKAIEHCTFAQCSSLETVVIPDSVEFIGAWAFAWTPWQDALSEEGSEWLVLGNSASHIYNGDATEIVVPSDYASYEFCANSAIKSITLSEGITSIPSYSCEALTGLEQIIVPSTIKTIGECAFRNTKVGELSFADGLERIDKSAFESSGTVILHLPDSVSYIDEEAFYKCSSVTIICSPDSYAAEYALAHGYSVSAE